MAKAKKTAPKQAQKAPAKQSAALKGKSSRAASKKVPKKLLTVEDKQRLIKPIDGFGEIAERFAAAWSDRKALKVTGLSPAKLLRALESAKRAAARENALRSKLEEKLRPLMDARLLAEHEAWKMVLDAYAVAKALARVDPEVGHTFAFVGDALTPRARKKTPSTSVETTNTTP
jgi:hypothetical protein